MLCMCGTDCTLAPAEIRENFILSADDIKSLSQLAFETAGINGCLPLSTCNRTEVYLSCDENADIYTVFDSVFGGYESYINILSGEDAIRHFFETACGLNSLIKR